MVSVVIDNSHDVLKSKVNICLARQHSSIFNMFFSLAQMQMQLKASFQIEKKKSLQQPYVHSNQYNLMSPVGLYKKYGLVYNLVVLALIQRKKL